MLYIEYLYAKFIFKSSVQKRMSLYKKLVSLLRNNFTLMDALSRLENIESKNGKKTGEPFAIALSNWQRNLEKGMSFADAVKWWIPQNELLLLSSGNYTSLDKILLGIVKLQEGQDKIKSSIFKAISYPLLLFILTFGVIVMVGLYLVPPLTQASNNVVWSGSAFYLVWLSNIVIQYWQLFVVIFILLILLISFSLGNWTGFFRTLFDKIPPYNIYKINLSVSWLMSLATMISSDMNIAQALKVQSEYSNKYLKNILDKTLYYVTNGDNLGNALLNSKTNFPNDEIIGDLIIYSDMNNFNDNLFSIAFDYLEESVEKVEKISNRLNTVGIFIISIIIAWVVYGTFIMQEQITATLM